VLSTRFKEPDGPWFEAYVTDGGYLAARKALTTMTAQQMVDEVSKSILRGLGGGIFDRQKVVLHPQAIDQAKVSRRQRRRP
jgi:NADH:ubiquinone oxidoreductase subunit F (NADH-binding)